MSEQTTEQTTAVVSFDEIQELIDEALARRIQLQPAKRSFGEIVISIGNWLWCLVLNLFVIALVCGGIAGIGYFIYIGNHHQVTVLQAPICETGLCKVEVYDNYAETDRTWTVPQVDLPKGLEEGSKLRVWNDQMSYAF